MYSTVATSKQIYSPGITPKKRNNTLTFASNEKIRIKEDLKKAVQKHHFRSPGNAEMKFDSAKVTFDELEAHIKIKTKKPNKLCNKTNLLSNSKAIYFPSVLHWGNSLASILMVSD